MIKKFSWVLVFLLFATPCYAAIVVGTNAGFVTVAPSADPTGGATSNLDTRTFASKFTSPSDATSIVELGWWCNNATEAADFDVGVYDHNVGDNNPEAVVGSLSQNNAKGTTSGWKKITGLNIPIDGSTIYWLAVQLDDTATTTNTDYNTLGAPYQLEYKDGQTALLSLFGSSNEVANRAYAIYAVYTTGVTAAGQVILIMN